MRIIVNPHKIEIIKDEAVNEKEIDISRCYFEFDDEITDSYVKEAYFTLKGNTYKQIIQNNECAFPSEILEEKGDIELGVVAYLVENEEEIKRYNPSPAYFDTWKGSLKDAKNSEPITPSEMEQFEQELQNGLNEIDDKIDEVDEKITEIDTKIENIDTAIEETNNLNLDVSDKVDGDVTVTLTKKDASTKTVVLSDGTSLEFNWDGTKLGIKTSDEEEYTYVDLQGIQGPAGPQGEAFRIKKTYSSVAEMNADFNNMEYGDYVMIASTVEIEDNAKLYTRGETQWIFITDFSGSQGIRGETGLTPSIQIGTVVSGLTPSVTRTGTDENPVLNFVLQKGDKGNTGDTGPTGNGISSITKTSTTGLVDTYTITYTNGNTTTFDVSNGNGIDRIEKTATVENRDTYTIYFTNGETTTYEVSNGEVTEEQLQAEVDRLSMIYNAFPSTSGEGTELTLNGTAEVPFKEINLKGNTSQEGTPTPETPQDIHVVSGNNSIEVCGKNLLPTNSLTPTYNTTTTLIDFGKDKTFDSVTLSFIFNGSYSQVTNVAMFDLRTNDNTHNYLTPDTFGLRRDTNYTNQQLSTTITNVTFRYLIVYFMTNNYNNFSANSTMTNLMLEKGTQATTYEAYKGASYPVNLGDIELCKIRDYQDKIDKSSGKNLFNSNVIQGARFFSNGSFFTRNDYVMNETPIPVEAGETYTFSAKNYTPSGNAGFVFFNNGTFVSSSQQSSPTFTVPSGVNEVYIDINNGSSPITPTSFSEYQLEKGTSSSEYEPYGTGWYLKKEIGKVDLGTLTWTSENEYNAGQFRSTVTASVLAQVPKLFGKLLCSIFIWQSGNVIFNNLEDGKMAITNSQELPILRVRNSQYSSLSASDFKTAMSGNMLYYQMFTPTYTEITDSTLLSQLEVLKKAISYDEQTNISQSNNGLPFIINAEAIMSLKNIFNQGN